MNILKSVMLVMFMLLIGMVSCKKEKEAEDTHHTEHTANDHHHSELSHDEENALGFKGAETVLIFAKYMAIKNALVLSNADMVKTEASELIEKIRDEEIKKVVDAIANSETIEDQREGFVIFTDKLEAILSDGALLSGKVYKQYCPMAFDNKGAYWLATEKEIRNPYFGDRMLKCGHVTATIE